MRRFLTALIVALILALGMTTQPTGAVFQNYSGDCTDAGCQSFLHNLWMFVNCQGSGRIFPFC